MLLRTCLKFCQFQSGVTFKSVAYKKRVYTNLFGIDLAKKLVNLSSGAPVDDTAAEIVLDVSDDGNI